MPFSQVPIGLALSRTSRAVTRAFDARLAAAGGSVPVWLVLLALRTRSVRNQRELAEVVGIQGATLSHHLNAMEDDGLVTRHRDPTNRRVHIVELTADGEAKFDRLRSAAVAHDTRLRAGFSDDEVAQLAAMLNRLSANVAGTSNAEAPNAPATGSGTGASAAPGPVAITDPSAQPSTCQRP
jgi:MarR family transcriptional regulator, transcriptional regulator for hemolysin